MAATEDLKREWGPSDLGAFEYLHERGYELIEGVCWLCDEFVDIAEQDRRAVHFLADEWGYPHQIVRAEASPPPRRFQH